MGVQAPQSSDSAPVTEHHLRRRLGLATATLMGIGVILGAGIYVIIGAAAGRAGNAVWLSFLIAAFAATLTALSYARLGKLRPKNAPEYQYLNMAFGRFPGFIASWLVLWSGIISAATVALGFAGYMEHLFGAPVLLSSIALIALSALIVFVGIAESAIMAIILTAIEAGGLAFIIVIGAPHIGEVNLLEAPLGFPGIAAAASLVFFAYLGFEGMANFAEEMKNPVRDLPKAIILAIIISTVLYLLVSLAAVSVVGWEALSGSSAPLAVVAASALGANADLLLTAIAIGATANTVLLLLLAASRALWAMSCAGVLPTVFCVVGERRRTPWAAIIVVAVLTGLFAAIRNIEQVAELTNFAILLAFAGVNAAAVKLFGSQRAPGHRARHVFVDIVLPAVGLAAVLGLVTNVGGRAALLGGALLVIGVIVYAIMRALSRRKEPGPDSGDLSV